MTGRKSHSCCSFYSLMSSSSLSPSGIIFMTTNRSSAFSSTSQSQPPPFLYSHSTTSWTGQWCSFKNFKASRTFFSFPHKKCPAPHCLKDRLTQGIKSPHQAKSRWRNPAFGAHFILFYFYRAGDVLLFHRISSFRNQNHIFVWIIFHLFLSVPFHLSRRLFETLPSSPAASWNRKGMESGIAL